MSISLILRGLLIFYLAHATYSDLNEADYHIDGIDEKFRDLNHRLESFANIICLKCERRNIDCGCGLKDKNPAFVLLGMYSQKYIKWREQITNYEDVQLRWMIVDTYDSGLGNQLLNVVNGLIVALLTNRVLVLKLSGGVNHNYILFDSVVSFMTDKFILSHGIRPNTTHVLDLWTQAGVDFMMCADWNAVPDDAVFLRHGVQDVHLAHANPHHGALLRDTFLGHDLFFLSHFLWTGEQELRETVRAATLPEPMPWDGERPLAELVADIRASRPLRVVGLHVRISTLYFEFIDTYHYPPRWEDSCPPDPAAADPAAQGGGDGGGDGPAVNALAGSDDFCYSSSLDSVLVCLLEQLYGCLPADCRRRSRVPGGLGPWWHDDAAAGGGGGWGNGSGIVVLWATDNDALAEPLLREVAAVPGLRVVRLRPGGAVRSDAHPSTARADAALLAEADELIASAGSTFAHAVHARALVAPHLLAFGDPCLGPGRVCARAAGPEAGLVARGPMHDVCTLVEWDGWHMGVQCRELHADCVSVLMDPGWTGELGGTIGCLQGAATCLPRPSHPPPAGSPAPPAAGGGGGDGLGVLGGFAGGVAHAELFQHVWAKRSRVLVADDYPHLYLPPCPYPHLQNPETLSRFRAAHAAASPTKGRAGAGRAERAGQAPAAQAAAVSGSTAGRVERDS